VRNEISSANMMYVCDPFFPKLSKEKKKSKLSKLGKKKKEYECLIWVRFAPRKRGAERWEKSGFPSIHQDKKSCR